MKSLMDQNAGGREQIVERGFELLATLLRRQRRAEQPVEILLRRLDLLDPLLLLSAFLRECGKPRLALLFTRLIHTRECVLLIDDVANAGHEPLGLHLVVLPTRIEIS